MIAYPYAVELYWRTGDTMTKWNEICASAIEEFGLTGDKFITHSTEDFMIFRFKSSEDAMLFKLKYT